MSRLEATDNGMLKTATHFQWAQLIAADTANKNLSDGVQNFFCPQIISLRTIFCV